MVGDFFSPNSLEVGEPMTHLSDRGLHVRVAKIGVGREFGQPINGGIDDEVDLVLYWNGLPNGWIVGA